MKIISNDITIPPDIKLVGGKATNLYRLKSMGIQVPNWVVIPADALLALLPSNYLDLNEAQIHKAIEAVSFSNEILSEIRMRLAPAEIFAVRSSATDEDGSSFSFAGQFESVLNVSSSQLNESFQKVWKSAFSARVHAYREKNQLSHHGSIAIIVQEMVEATVSGVAFGINPITGNRKEKIINSVFGLGEGLVSGALNADIYTISEGNVSSQIAKKETYFIPNPDAQSGTKEVALPQELVLASSLKEFQVMQINHMLDRCFDAYGQYMDIEFAVYKDAVYYLQARPVTNLNKLSNPLGVYILWDNSNIIESYPGVTTPLTFSFISKSYEGAYKQFSAYMGVDNKTIQDNERVFANTLGLLNGRVYYNLKTWYHMLAMLPGYSINARFMEKMMGVKERFDIPETYRLSKVSAWWRIIKMGAQMYWRYVGLPKKRKSFMELLNTTITQYKQIDYKSKNAHELMQLYLHFERKLLNEWKAPLLNDFFAMIWFGVLQKRCEKYQISKNVNIHNDLLCGSSDIISVQPVHRSMAIATIITADKALYELFSNQEAHQILYELQHQNEPNFVKLYAEITQYIQEFGERCIGELKLETVSYTQDPTRFIAILKSYVKSGITTARTSNNIEEKLRNNAYQELQTALKYKFIKKRKLLSALQKARTLVSARENLRYERTRAFGIVRELFFHIGKNFYAEQIIDAPRDIFYLTKEEIFTFIEGTAVSQKLKETVALRKAEYKVYEQQKPPSERFATYGIVYHGNNFYNTDRVAKVEGQLKGIGCCPGIVRGKVRVVYNPLEVVSLEGDILVTSSTDPGWVTLFPSASAIIVERGSLLSHSAIVSREMGIPCIVSVTGLLKTLNTGDEIEMDGSTGFINIIKVKHE